MPEDTLVNPDAVIVTSTAELDAAVAVMRAEGTGGTILLDGDGGP